MKKVITGFVIVHGLPLRQHTFMQNAGYENTSRFGAVEHNVPAVFKAPQSGTRVVAAMPNSGIVGEPLATRLKLIKIADGLIPAPGA